MDSPSGVAAAYEAARAVAERAVAAAQSRQSELLFYLCATGVVVALAAWWFTRHGLPLWAIPAPLSVLAALARRYAAESSRAAAEARRADFYARGLDRLCGRWSGAGTDGRAFRRCNHLYQRDLDVLGEGSLFELLCTVRTGIGQARLADYLLNPADAETIRSRQRAVRELAPRTDIRERIALLGAYQSQGASPAPLRQWLELPGTRVGVVRWLAAASSCAVAGTTAAVFAGSIPLHAALWPCLGVGILHWLVAREFGRRTRPTLEHIRKVGPELQVLKDGLAYLGALRFDTPELRGLSERASGTAPLGALQRLVNAVYECDKDWFYGISRVLLIPEQLACSIENWRAAHGNRLAVWVDTWGEFEALNALACYAFEHPDDVYPEIGAGCVFEAEGLGHPLIPDGDCVRNDVELNAANRFYLVSGSNMAGKSTLLRAIGVNAVLAGAGAPVRARRARISPFTVCASIAAADSLLEGRSRFLAEVERLRDTIRAAENGQPVLFLVDEILSGTNSDDRRVAARAVLSTLVRAGAVGALSTHDLALASIAEEPELCGRNVHMESSDPADPLAFDFRLKRGVSRRSNALAIARLAGVTV